MSDPDNTPNGSKQDWEGFREVDRAIAEDRLSKYSVQKAWADPWERKARASALAEPKRPVDA